MDFASDYDCFQMSNIKYCPSLQPGAFQMYEPYDAMGLKLSI